MSYEMLSRRQIEEGSSYLVSDHIKCWVGFFFITLASKMIAPIFPRFGLPTITGNLAVGVVCGPYALDLITKEDITSLAYINTIALAFITTSAGAELQIAPLKAMIRLILAQTVGVSLITFVPLLLYTMAVAKTSMVRFMNDMTATQQWSVAMLFASIAMAHSPAAAVAVVRELRSKGQMTTTFMGITVLSDIAVLISITLALSYAKAEFNGSPFSPANLGVVIATMVASVLLGGVVGGAYMICMKFSRWIVHSLVFPIGFAVFIACQELASVLAANIQNKDLTVHPEPLLMCIVGGFLTANFSKYHHRFVEVLEHGAPYIFPPFFTLVGASVQIEVFIAALPFGISFSALRCFFMFLGTAPIGIAMKQDKRTAISLWMTLISQAGFSLGLAAEIAHQYPGWGKNFQSFIISCVIVNQIVGPVFCKLALQWSGEAGMASGMEAIEEAEADPDAQHVSDKFKAVVIGVTPRSKAIVLSLLQRRWGVTVFAKAHGEAETIRSEVEDWAVGALS